MFYSLQSPFSSCCTEPPCFRKMGEIPRPCFTSSGRSEEETPTGEKWPWDLGALNQPLYFPELPGHCSFHSRVPFSLSCGDGTPGGQRQIGGRVVLDCRRQQTQELMCFPLEIWKKSNTSDKSYVNPFSRNRLKSDNQNVLWKQ